MARSARRDGEGAHSDVSRRVGQDRPRAVGLVGRVVEAPAVASPIDPISANGHGMRAGCRSHARRTPQGSAWPLELESRGPRRACRPGSAAPLRVRLQQLRHGDRLQPRWPCDVALGVEVATTARAPAEALGSELRGVPPERRCVGRRRGRPAAAPGRARALDRDQMAAGRLEELRQRVVAGLRRHALDWVGSRPHGHRARWKRPGRAVVPGRDRAPRHRGR